MQNKKHGQKVKLLVVLATVISFLFVQFAPLGIAQEQCIPRLPEKVMEYGGSDEWRSPSIPPNDIRTGTGFSPMLDNYCRESNVPEFLDSAVGFLVFIFASIPAIPTLPFLVLSAVMPSIFGAEKTQDTWPAGVFVGIWNKVASIGLLTEIELSKSGKDRQCFQGYLAYFRNFDKLANADSNVEIPESIQNDSTVKQFLNGFGRKKRDEISKSLDKKNLKVVVIDERIYIEGDPKEVPENPYYPELTLVGKVFGPNYVVSGKKVDQQFVLANGVCGKVTYDIVKMKYYTHASFIVEGSGYAYVPVFDSKYRGNLLITSGEAK